MEYKHNRIHKATWLCVADKEPFARSNRKSKKPGREPYAVCYTASTENQGVLTHAGLYVTFCTECIADQMMVWRRKPEDR